MKKNKFLLSIFIAVFVIVCLGSVLAEDIAYIAKDSSKVDSNIINLIESANYTYKIIYPGSLSSTNFSKYDIIIVGEGNFGADALKIPVNKKNSILLNTYHLEDWKWMLGNPTSMFSDSPRNVMVYDNLSLIVHDVLSVNGEFSSYLYGSSTENYQVDYLAKSKVASGVNTIVADDLSLLKLLGIYTPKNGALVATVNKGAQLRDGQISQARGVFLGFTKTYLWTEDVKKIFYNSIEWARDGEDRDKDGFYGDLDCDDTDPNVNPNGIEIPYDGIDQDCSGSDLNDLDKDGFIAEVAGGNDCNDNDSTYNINSTNLTKNCVNDAPVTHYINTVSIQETQIAEIVVTAEDPEGDEMTYSINDSRFVQDINNSSHFFWQTGYNDAGYYMVNITVSDGELKSYREVGVRVKEKNKAPEFLGEIPVQEWQEDTNHTLNITSYFYDLDGDQLYYLIDDTSSDLSITISSIEDGIVYFTVKKDWFGEDWVVLKATDLVNSAKTNNITLRVLPVNDAPVLIEPIPNLNMEEDSRYSLYLSEYFEDVDDELEYTFTNTSHITLFLEEETLEIIPEENWYGEEEIEIKASDGEYELSWKFSVNVESVNDAPVVQAIPDKFILAGDKVEISASATDIEGDEFNFSMNDSRFVQADYNYFEWQTSDRDFGVYNFKVGAYDGMDYGYANIKINVLQKILINELVWGNDGWVELYNPENSSFDLGNCNLENGAKNLMLNGTLGNYGFAAFDWNALTNQGIIELSCSNVLIDRVEYSEFNNQNSLGRMPDGSTLTNAFILFNYPTKGVSNSADVTKPEVELNSPENNTLYTETRDVLFEFSAKDNMAEELECSLFANSKFIEKGDFENNTLGNFYIDYLQDGIYFWNIECSDGFNKNSAPESRMINISAPDMPVLNYIGNRVVSENNELKFFIYSTDQDGDTIELRALDLPEGASFTDNGNGNGVFIWKPNYNQSGTYNVKFFAKDATGLEDSETITILVGNTKEPPKFSDADVCSEDNKNSSIELSIKDPDEGDEFEIGDIINGTIKIKNKLDDSRDFDVTVYLYDTKEEQVVEEFDDSIDINDGKSGEVEFSLEIPEDIDETDEFAIYAYVESDEDECNSNYIGIEINRKKHEVIIGEIKIDKEVVSPGDELEIKVNAENLGREDEEIFILLEIPSLSISRKSEATDIEKYGDDDSETNTFTILIPENAPEGIYEIKASVTFDSNGKNSKSKEFTVSKGAESGQTQTQNQVQQNNVISLSSSSQGKTLALGNSQTTSTTSTTPTGSALNLGGSLTPSSTGTTTSTTNTVTGNPTVLRSSSTSSGNKFIREKETLSFRISEKTQKEYTPEVKVEFSDVPRKLRAFGDNNSNSWVLLAVVLGLLVIIILILILVLK